MRIWLCDPYFSPLESYLSKWSQALRVSRSAEINNFDEAPFAPNFGAF
jgi:hypothetical protein